MRRPNLAGLPPQGELPEGYSLREYRPGDAAGLAQLLARAEHDPGWDEARVRREITDAPGVDRTLLIEYAGKPVATATSRLAPEDFPGSGYVHWVASDPDHRGKRLGATVTIAVLHRFAEIGCHDAVLETDDHRLAAIKTYQRLGFVPVHREPSHIARWAKIASDLLAAANI